MVMPGSPLLAVEDMILVTDTGFEHLSAGAPKSVEEIERATG